MGQQTLLQKLASHTPLGSLKRNGQRDVHIIFCLWAHGPVLGWGSGGLGIKKLNNYKDALKTKCSGEALLGLGLKRKL